MRVEVARPVVRDDTVHFSWTQSAPNPFQHANAFSFRHEGIDLARFFPALFVEMFLGLQMRVFAAYDEEVELVFPDPVSAASVAFWRTYHAAPRVSVRPLADAIGGDVWARERPAASGRDLAVLLGGGKGSTLMTALLSELYGRERIVALRLNLPARPDPAESARLEARDEALMLRPARESYGVATGRGWVDYMANLTRDGLRARPHLELFVLAVLPALIWRGVSLCTTSLPWTQYAIRRQEDGSYWFRYDQSRPEALADVSAHLGRMLGQSLTITNLNLLLSPLATFTLLARRYPHLLQRIVMCNKGGADQRWCYVCKKCAEYAFHGLALGIVDPGFDYDRLFRAAAYVRRLVRYAESGVELSVHGNAPWRPFVAPSQNYTTICHDLALIRPGLISDRIGREARANLLLLQAILGNRTYPHAEMMPAAAVDLLGNEPARRIAAIAQEYAPLVDRLPGPFFDGATEVDYDFTVRMPTRTAGLARVRESADGSEGARP